MTQCHSVIRERNPNLSIFKLTLLHQLILAQSVTELTEEQKIYSYFMQDNTMAHTAQFSNR